MVQIGSKVAQICSQMVQKGKFLTFLLNLLNINMKQ